MEGRGGSSTSRGKTLGARAKGRTWILYYPSANSINKTRYLFLEYDVLSLPIFHHSERLERADYIVRVDGQLLAHVWNSKFQNRINRLFTNRHFFMFYHLFIYFIFRHCPGVSPSIRYRTRRYVGSGVYKYIFFYNNITHTQTHITNRIILSFADTRYLGEFLQAFLVPISTMFF